MPDGRIHGVWLWSGPSAPVDDPPADAGAVVLNADTGVLSITEGAALAMGLAPSDPLTAMSFAELYRYFTPNPGEIEALRLMVSATEGASHCATWPGSDYLGRPTLCHFASRIVLESNGQTRQRLSRALNIRVGSPPEPIELLEQQVLEATAEPNAFRALLTTKTQMLIKWIDPPPPELHWQHDPLDRPKVHPDDQQKFDAMLDDLIHGSTQADIRLRRHDDGWMPVQCTAQLVTLGANATAALVTARRSTNRLD